MSVVCSIAAGYVLGRALDRLLCWFFSNVRRELSQPFEIEE